MTRAQNLAVVVTCLVAALTYAGAVTIVGMALFVLPGVVGAALLSSFFVAQRMPVAALAVVGPLILGWSELVNVWSGTGYGTAARSTFIASGCTLVAVVAARSSSPALFLLPVAGSVCGALLLGAGGEVRLVAVLTAVSAVVTLGAIERSQRRWTERPRRGAAVVLLPLLVGAVAVGAVLLQAQRDSKPPEALAAGQAHPHIKPPWTDPLGKAANRLGSPPPPPLHRTAPRSRPHPPTGKTHQHRKSEHPASTSHKPPPNHVHRTQPPPSPSRVWLYVLAGVLLVVLLLAARLLAVRLAWRRVRRRLVAGAPAEQITGLWAWMRIRLDACRLPLTTATSPDLVAAGRAMDDLPPDVLAPLRELATSTTTAAFAHDQALGDTQVADARNAAGLAEASARQRLTRVGRARLAFRTPSVKVPATR